MIEKIIPTKYHNKIYNLKKAILKNYFVKSYSQEGEDMVLNRLFGAQKKGFYVDIGAHHPFRFSNTFFFYKKGWRGINIDAMPGSMEAFNKYRKFDINIEAAVSDKTEELTFYVFEEPAINSLDVALSESRIKNGNRLLAKKKVTTQPLEKILDDYLPPDTEIDFMSIDVEGVDLQILKSNNWDKYQPKIVLVECLNFEIENIANEAVYHFMVEHNYYLVSKTLYTCFFKRRDS